jgi:4-phosphopantoate--beta-alanine ligase
VGSADVVLIPLEDGDRAEALRAWDRRVIAIDLNPLARTSRTAHVTIVDELTRALPVLVGAVREMAEAEASELEAMVSRWDNVGMLQRTLDGIAKRLGSMEPGGHR